MTIASYLANKPVGAPLVFLIMCIVICAIGAIIATWAKDLWRLCIIAAIAFLALALVWS